MLIILFNPRECWDELSELQSECAGKVQLNVLEEATGIIARHKTLLLCSLQKRESGLNCF